MADADEPSEEGIEKANSRHGKKSKAVRDQQTYHFRHKTQPTSTADSDSDDSIIEFKEPAAKVVKHTRGEEDSSSVEEDKEVNEEGNQSIRIRSSDYKQMMHQLQLLPCVRATHAVLRVPYTLILVALSVLTIDLPEFSVPTAKDLTAKVQNLEDDIEEKVERAKEKFKDKATPGTSSQSDLSAGSQFRRDAELEVYGKGVVLRILTKHKALADYLMFYTDQPKTTVTQESLEKRLGDIKEARVCKACRNAPATILFMPCRHISTCERCSQQMDVCSVCGEEIEQKIKTYRT